ncbi:MAG: glycosyltransferase [Williamsia sp.]|nr:glycosyltransferase [Williamsia sp.]
MEGYFNAVGSILNKDELELLLIHNAPTEEELAVVNKYLPRFPFIKHIVVPREGLYATWNRGIKMATSPYVTNWNVDDVRLPDSLIHQANALDQHPEAALAYGDFIIVDTYGKKEGKQVNEPEYDASNRTFLRQHHIGCFAMWRKNIHDQIGYFDEQFRLIADLDFQIRVALQSPLIKIQQQLGYYLEGTPGNLSSNLSMQFMEMTALHMRYGNFNLLFLTDLVKGLSKIRLFQYKWFGAYHAMKPRSVREKLQYMLRFPLIGISIFNFPRHWARKYLRPYLSRRKNISALVNAAQNN